MSWLAVGVLAGLLNVGGGSEAILSEGDMGFLQGLTEAVMEASRVGPGAKVGPIGPNATGGTLIRPGGRACYPAFWIRDYAMSLESGLVTPEEQRHALLLTAKNQRSGLWELSSGSIVPDGAIADHVTFGGKPIYFAGTLEDYEGQGGPRWGKLPCLDDHFFFVHMAAAYVEATGDADVLGADVEGMELIERLGKAFHVPPYREETGVVYVSEENRGVTFGFTDCISHTGDLFFCSVLKYRAARELEHMCGLVGDDDAAKEYGAAAAKIKASLPKLFGVPGGLLKASTGLSGQPDVWGTAFAVYVGALDPEHERAACERLAQAFREGTLAWKGNIRHVLTSDDFYETTAWEKSLAAKNRYQNGAYWGTPTGWVCYAIAKADWESARKLAAEYVAELREGDFRKGEDFGSPWECMHPDGGHRQNPVYLTSVTCPLAAFRRINEERAAAEE